MRRQSKDAPERPVKMISRHAGLSRNLFERDTAVHIFVQIFASDLQPPEQLFFRGSLRGGNPRELRLDLTVKHQKGVRNGQKIFLEAAWLKFLSAAVRERPHLRKDRPLRIGMQPRKEMQARRISPRRIERSFKRCRCILGDLFHKTAAKEHAAGFDRLHTVDVHRIALLIIENEKCIWIDKKIASANSPMDFAADHRLDGKRSGKIIHHVSPTRRVKDEVVGAEPRSFRKQKLWLLFES